MPKAKPSSPKPRKSARSSSKETTNSATTATKLLLDPEAVARGERFAERQGTNISRLVNRFLLSLPDVDPSNLAVQLTPTVRRLYGVAKGSSADRETYRERLRKKYRRA